MRIREIGELANEKTPRLRIQHRSIAISRIRFVSVRLWYLHMYRCTFAFGGAIRTE